MGARTEPARTKGQRDGLGGGEGRGCPLGSVPQRPWLSTGRHSPGCTQAQGRGPAVLTFGRPSASGRRSGACGEEAGVHPGLEDRKGGPALRATGKQSLRPRSLRVQALGITDGSSPPEASSAAPPGAPGSQGGRPPPPLRLGGPGLPARRQHAPPSARRILLLGCTSDCPSAWPSVGLSSLAPSEAAGPIHPPGLCPFLRAGSARRAAAMLMRRGWGAAGDRRGRGDEVGAPAGGNQRREAGGSAVGARPREGRDGSSQRPDLCIQNRRGPLAGAGKGRRPRPAHPLAERGVRGVETSCHLCSGVAAWRAARSGGRPPPRPPDAAARGAWVRPARAGV